MRIITTLSISFLITLIISVADCQSIKGYIYDSDIGIPVADANIKVIGTYLGTTSNKEGNFEIQDLKSGNYHLFITIVGYETHEEEITLSNDSNCTLQIPLKNKIIQLNQEVVITASRSKYIDYDLPDAITILNSDYLRQNIQRTLAEALSGTTGVWLQKTNHGGGSPIIRGLTGNQNLILIDGVRLNNSTFRYGPNQYLNTIDPLIVEQTEIIRGSGSVLYGSDALGGVINVLTKNPRFIDKGFKASGNAYLKYMSSDMEKTGRCAIELRSKKIAVLGGISYKNFGDLIAGGKLGIETPTGYYEISGDIKAQIRLSSNYLLTIAYQNLQQNNVPRYDKIIGKYSKYHFDPQMRQLTYTRLESFYKNKWFNNIKLTFSFNRSYEKRIKQKKGESKIKTEKDDVNTLGTTLEVISKPLPNWNFTTGVDFYFDKVKSTASEKEAKEILLARGYYPDGALSYSFAVFSQHTIVIKKFNIIAGGRINAFKLYLKDEIFGNVEISPIAYLGSLSILYKLHKNYHLSASVNTGFRAPNINDLSSFGTFAYGIEVPSPYLSPEKSINTEIGFKSRTNKFSGSAFIYHNQLYDLIDRTPAQYNGKDSINGEKVYKKENIAEAYIQGFEISIEYQVFRRLILYGILNYTFGENITKNEPMRRIPPFNGGIGIRYKSKKGFWGNLVWLYAGKQNRLSSGDISDSRIAEGGTPGWDIIKISTGYSWRFIHFNVALNNIFNKAYRTHGSGIDGYGIHFILSTQINF